MMMMMLVYFPSCSFSLDEVVYWKGCLAVVYEKEVGERKEEEGWRRRGRRKLQRKHTQQNVMRPGGRSFPEFTPNDDAKHDKKTTKDKQMGCNNNLTHACASVADANAFGRDGDCVFFFLIFWYFHNSLASFWVLLMVNRS